jgi:hypothetical protein
MVYILLYILVGAKLLTGNEAGIAAFNSRRNRGDGAHRAQTASPALVARLRQQ